MKPMLKSEPTPTKFPHALNDKLGKTVSATGIVLRRSITSVPDKQKANEEIKMPLIEVCELRIAGFDDVIPKAILKSPALWHIKAKTLDAISFRAVLIRENSQFIGFRLIKDVQVLPFQQSLFT